MEFCSKTNGVWAVSWVGRVFGILFELFVKDDLIFALNVEFLEQF